MAIDRSFLASNRASRARLRDQVARLTDQDLGRVGENGWTIAAGLAHVAFYDRRAQVLLEKWRHGAEPAASPADVDVINDALHYLATLIPPRDAANEAVAAAEAVDRGLEQLDDVLFAQVNTTQSPRPNRSHHREEHLDEIARILESR